MASDALSLKIAPHMSIYPANPESLQQAASMIREGQVVAFPTETVYGLGADATNALAVARIFEVKNRPHFDPLITHIADFSDLEKFAHTNELAIKLARKFWPGPLTLVLKKKAGIADLVTSGLPTIAIRMPQHPVALDLIRLAGKPIAAPSANPFGYLSPTTAAHVEEQLGRKVSMILDGGACATGVESTIIDLSIDGQVRLLRPGGIAHEEIEKITGPLQRVAATSNPIAPGQLPQHYAPRKKLEILTRKEMANHPHIKQAAVLFCKNPVEDFGQKQTTVLSESGDLRESAANLFSALHDLDQSSTENIFAEPVTETGLGLAIMDRLRRASSVD